MKKKIRIGDPGGTGETIRRPCAVHLGELTVARVERFFGCRLKGP